MKFRFKYEWKIPIRCLDEDKLFPPSKPIFCEERSVKPYFEIKCCSEDDCNKYIRFELPKRGEIYIPHTFPPIKTKIDFINRKLTKKQSAFSMANTTSQIKSNQINEQHRM